MLLISAALATTVAVVPLEPAGTGAPVDGLGRALAAMLTTDLSAAPGLTLVERAQLDAVTAELDLGDGKFLDPATAQRFGKGLGAEFLVVGDFAVVGPTFVLDARLVRVETGTVLKAANASGTVEGFVDVEKKVVTGLLDGLDVKLAEDARTRILAAAPTRRFDAFSAYGAGLAREHEGKLPEAQASYGVALSADPSFTLAADALQSLRSALDDAAAARLRKTSAARAALLDRVLLAYPAPTARPDRKAKAAFILRLLALEEQGRACERYAEMRKHLDLVDWKIGYGSGGYRELWTDTTALAVTAGLSPSEADDPGRHRDTEFQVQTHGAGLYGSVGRWLYDFPTMLLDVPSSPDMLTTMTRCLSVPEQLTELTRLRDAVAAHGLAGEQVFDYPIGLGERLEWSALSIRARDGGVDANMAARIRDLVAAHDDVATPKALGGGTARQWVEGQARQLLAMGVVVERERVSHLGYTEATLADALAAVASGDPKRVDLGARCQGLKNLQPFAAAMAGKPHYPGLGATLAPWRDLGCFLGTPARFATPDAAISWVRSAPSRVRSTEASCTAAFAELPAHLPAGGAPPDSNAAAAALSWYYGTLVLPLCASDGVATPPDAR